MNKHSTTSFDYSTSGYDIRPDLSQAYSEVWGKIAAPGNWWRGKDRVAIAAQVRAAKECQLCRERKKALSPFAVNGSHNAQSDLPEVAIDAVHRLTTDPSRLTEAWLSECNEQGLSAEQYIELLGIVVAVISIDAFHRAMGFEMEDLPTPVSGEPSGYRPKSAIKADAWVPVISAAMAEGDEADLYGGQTRAGNVISAMSLVPDSVRILKTLSSAQYIPDYLVPDPTSNGGRKISRAQMELLAARVSVMSDCFY